jgi:hypothetical protein
MHSRGILRPTPGRQSTILRSTATSRDCGGRNSNFSPSPCARDPSVSAPRIPQGPVVDLATAFFSHLVPTISKVCRTRQESLSTPTTRGSLNETTPTNVISNAISVAGHNDVSTSFPTTTENSLSPALPEIAGSGNPTLKAARARMDENVFARIFSCTPEKLAVLGPIQW